MPRHRAKESQAAFGGRALDFEPLPGPVVFIDGGCLLCSRAVVFLAARDPAGTLRFAHLQGDLAGRWLPGADRDVGPEGTVVLLEPDVGNRVSTRSRAVLRALGRLGGGWRLLGVVASTPGLPGLLDLAYRYVARRREQWFGRGECLVPTPALRARFLEAPTADYDGAPAEREALAP